MLLTEKEMKYLKRFIEKVEIETKESSNEDSYFFDIENEDFSKYIMEYSSDRSDNIISMLSDISANEKILVKYLVALSKKYMDESENNNNVDFKINTNQSKLPDFIYNF